MKVQKPSLRSCVITREKFPKNELIRVVRTPAGEVIVDINGNANGRGAYLKKDLAVIGKAKIKKTLNRHLGVEVADSIFDELEQIIKQEE